MLAGLNMTRPMCRAGAPTGGSLGATLDPGAWAADSPRVQRILITGGTGMLGRALVREWTGRAILFPAGPEQFDLRDAAAVGDAVRRVAPQLIIHAAAYTNVDGAE